MTDRYHGLVVVLDKDMRTDDAEPLMQAIRQMRGVLSVGGEVADLTTHTAYMRAKRELESKLWEVLYPKDKP